MIKIMDINAFTKNLMEVKSHILFSGENFDDDGLLSEKIFGPEGSSDRQKTYAYIDLYCTVIHPVIYDILIKLQRNLKSLFSTESYFKIESDGSLVPCEQDEEGAIIGITDFLNNFKKIKLRGETPTREKYIKFLNEMYDKKLLGIQRVIVIPPEFRPAYKDEDGLWMIDQINDYYIDIIKKSTQVSKTNEKEELYNVLNYGVQKSVLALNEYVKTKISKKTGIIREQLLGKRMDFSGRAVITPNPNLKPDEIGIPLRMATTILMPYIIHDLVYTNNYPDREKLKELVKKATGVDFNIDSLKTVLKFIKNGEKIDEELKAIIFESANRVSEDRVIITKRDPVLHFGSIRAFKIKIWDGDTIQLCPLIVGSFNADFDGDQMAIFLPLSREAQNEAKMKLMKLNSSSSFADLLPSISMGMASGVHVLTKNVPPSQPFKTFRNIEELTQETDIYKGTFFKGRKTTIGKAIFNSCFPMDFKFIDYTVNKSKMKDIFLEVYKKYDEKTMKEVFYRIQKISFKYATLYPYSFTLKNLELPEKVKKLKKKIDVNDPENSQKVLDEIHNIVKDNLKKTPFNDLVEAGATKGWSQPMQLLAAKGIVLDTEGNLLPTVTSSFSEGLSNSEYFNASASARRGIINRVVNTASTGYFARKLVYLLNDVELNKTLKDCRTDRTLVLKLDSSNMKKLNGRYIIENGKPVLFNPETKKVGDIIKLRTPIYCKSKQLCHTCYGELLYKHGSPFVGVLAAQTLSERITQFMMSTFHDTSVKIEKKDIIGDILDNLLESIDRKTLSKYIYQEENEIGTKLDAKLKIDLENYVENETIIFDDDGILLESLIGVLEFEDGFVLDVNLDYTVKLANYGEISKHTKEELEILINKDILFLSIPIDVGDLKAKLPFVEGLLAGKKIHKTPEEILRKLLTIKSLKNVEQIHIEVLISNILRDADNMHIPARLGKKWNPAFANIKEIVFLTGFIQGLEFENINKAISYGLLYKDTSPSPLEKVLTGEKI